MNTELYLNSKWSSYAFDSLLEIVLFPLMPFLWSISQEKPLFWKRLAKERSYYSGRQAQKKSISI